MPINNNKKRRSFFAATTTLVVAAFASSPVRLCEAFSPSSITTFLVGGGSKHSQYPYSFSKTTTATEATPSALHLHIFRHDEAQQQSQQQQQQQHDNMRSSSSSSSSSSSNSHHAFWQTIRRNAASLAATTLLTVSLTAATAATPAFAENELSAKYGGGLDTSLVDQTCLVNHCSLQATTCLKDDPDCRKGLTCTAKCLGDNACITGCMARYGNVHLDNLLKCTIEDHECIKVAILPGGADEYGQEPAAPAPVVPNFNMHSLEGSWYKVVGYNPNYDCYACQRNTFSTMSSSSSSDQGTHGNFNPFSFVSNNYNNHNNNKNNNKMYMDVEFSMPHLLPDGSPPPPMNTAMERILLDEEFATTASSKSNSKTATATTTKSNSNVAAAASMPQLAQSIGLNAYNTHEVMVFDTPASSLAAKPLVMTVPNNNNNKHAPQQQDEQQQQAQEQVVVSYARTAHSEGEMFGLKFWENWYVIGENDPDQPEFKFIYYNGKTRQNTYEGAFIYSRTEELSPASMKKVYKIAQEAGMNPDQFCRIRNKGCFKESDSVKTEPETGLGAPSNPFRGILASTRVSQLLGVEPVAARDTVRRGQPTASELNPPSAVAANKPQRAWWLEVGDYLENPHRHFQVMDQLRRPMVWPDEVIAASSSDRN